VIPAGATWDRRFAEHPWPNEPDPFLVELAASLPPGRGLDLGSGPGRNSLWLAEAGWVMTLVDASAVALDQARERATTSAMRLETVLADVVGWQPDGPPYDLVIVANLHPGTAALAEILDSAAQALVTGGHLYVVGHDLASLGRHGPPDPDRLLTIDRLSGALPSTLALEVLERRSRHLEQTDPAAMATGVDTDAKDFVVVAWATK